MEQNWYDRLRTLEEEAKHDPHHAGEQALRLFEEWLFEQARDLGFKHHASGMNTYVEYIARRGRLSKQQSARAERYVDIRNCLAHRSGLLMGAGLARELIDFLMTLFRSTALTAEQIMSRTPETVTAQDPLRDARDKLLRRGISQLPVLDGDRVVALLTERDIVALQARIARQETGRDELLVKDAMNADHKERLRFLPPQAPYDEVMTHLQSAPLQALLVTAGGQAEGPLLGIITVSDLLPKL